MIMGGGRFRILTGNWGHCLRFFFFFRLFFFRLFFLYCVLHNKCVFYAVCVCACLRWTILLFLYTLYTVYVPGVYIYIYNIIYTMYMCVCVGSMIFFSFFVLFWFSACKNRSKLESQVFFFFWSEQTTFTPHINSHRRIRTKKKNISPFVLF